MASVPSMQTTITLVAQHADGRRAECVLEVDNGVFVGTSALCGLHLGSDDRSEVHCQISIEEGRFWVHDWESTLDTFVNNQPITSQSHFTERDELRVGDFRISVENRPIVVESNDDAMDDSCEATLPATELESISQPAADDAIDDATCDATDDAICNTICNTICDEVNPTLPTQQDESEPNFFSPIDSVDGEIDQEVPASHNDPFAADLSFEGGFFEGETFDRETVDLLRAEIEDLQASLARRDDEAHFPTPPQATVDHESSTEQSNDQLAARLQELLDEATQSDDRIATLEEMLRSSEDANRAEQEERQQLDSWVQDIERRIGQREDEQAAETDALRGRLEEVIQDRDEAQRQLQQAAKQGVAPNDYEDTLEKLQQQNNELKEKLSAANQERTSLKNRLDHLENHAEESLCEERAKFSQELAKVSRLRYELSNKLVDIDESTLSTSNSNEEASKRIQALRDHLKEIHQKESEEQSETTLSSRITSLWKRMQS